MNGTEFARLGGSYNTAYIGTYQLLSQNISGNYSTFRLYGYFYYGGGTRVTSSYSTFQLHGSTIQSGGFTFTNGYHLLGTVDINVYHNNDGTFPSTYIGLYANSYQINGNFGGNISASTIPRQANVTSASNFTDETNPTVTYSNPGGFRINAKLEFASTSIIRDNISNTGSYTFELTDDERELLRSKCPNSNSLAVREVIATCIGGTTENYWSYQDKAMTIVNANPTFSNCTFKDVNETTVALTGNNQNVIKGYSNVQLNITNDNKATALKSATMNKYRFSCLDNSVDVAYSETEDIQATLFNVSSGTFNVYAIDSRNNSTQVVKNAETVINYTDLLKGDITVSRENGVSENVILKINGTVNIVNFGVVTNSIKEAKYRYKIKGSSSFSDYKDIKLTVDSKGNFSFSNKIDGDTATLGFDINNSYDIEVYVADELSNVTFTTTLGSGIPNIALHKNGVAIMGKYDESVGGLLQISGKRVDDKILELLESESDN